MKHLRCTRILSEVWTPGKAESPDGPSREMTAQCVRELSHSGDHVFGDYVERSR